MKTLTYKTNINCGNCIKSVTPFLNELDNLDDWRVDTDNADKILTATIDDDHEEAVVNAVKRAGFEIQQISLSS